MPELPEVETTVRGVRPWLENQRLLAIHVHNPSLRWPVPAALAAQTNARIVAVTRRAKYILMQLDNGRHLLCHLGMSGSLRITEPHAPLKKHDHIDIELADNGRALRYHDPRRFGCWLVIDGAPAAHPLLAELGPEPLDDAFTGATLKRAAGASTRAVKNLIMDARAVVGVGNIYASEALHLAGIHPRRAAGRIALARYERLAAVIKQVLAEAIAQGGTTLNDFLNAEGNPGYFAQRLRVYGRAGEACKACGAPVRSEVIGQRNSFYCPRCQR